MIALQIIGGVVVFIACVSIICAMVGAAMEWGVKRYFENRIVLCHSCGVRCSKENFKEIKKG